MTFLTVFRTTAPPLTSLLLVIATAIRILIAWPFMMTSYGPEKKNGLLKAVMITPNMYHSYHANVSIFSSSSGKFSQ